MLQACDDVEAGTHVKKQLQLWDTCLEWRIRLQKALIACNSLPQPQYWSTVSAEGGKDFAVARQQTDSQLRSLAAALSGLCEVLQDGPCLSATNDASNVGENEDIGSDEGSAIASDADASDDDDDAVDGDGDDEDASVDDDRVRATDSRHSQAVSLNKSRQETEECFHDDVVRLRNRIMEEWYNKTKFSMTGTKKGLESFEQAPTAQIRQIMSDEQRLLRRSQLRRSLVAIIGKPEAEAAQQEVGGRQQNYDAEIFDDDDFYHQLLKQLIDSKTSDSADSLSISKKWLEVQQLRRKMKRKVDTRGSKGRKLRYETHKQLLNFMAPEKTFEMTEDAKDELFASLFQ